MEAADDLGTGVAQATDQVELRFRVDQETTRWIVGDVGGLVDGKRAPAFRRRDPLDQPAALVRVGARGGLEHACGQFVGKVENAYRHSVNVSVSPVPPHG